MTAGEHPPAPHTAEPYSALLNIHIWDSGHGYTKAEATWARSVRASRTAHRTLLASAFYPSSLEGVWDAVGVLRVLLQELEKRE